MANKSTSTAARKLALAAIAPAALNEGNARSRLITLLRQAGARYIAPLDKGEQESIAAKAARIYQRAIRDEYIVGRIASRIASNGTDEVRITAARKLLAAPNAKSDKADRRTDAQELLYGAARVAWSALLKDAGIMSADKRGGDTSKSRKPAMAGSKGGAPKAKAPEQARKVMPDMLATPKVKKPAELLHYFKTVGAQCLAMSNQNGGLVKTDWHKMVACFNDYFQSVELED